MFSEPRRNVIESEEGFSVEVLGQASVRYKDASGALVINSEFLLGEPSIRILLCAPVKMEAAGLIALLPMDRRQQVGENIRRAFAATGHEADIVYRT